MASDWSTFPEFGELAAALVTPADRFSIARGLLDELVLLDRERAGRYALIGLWSVGRDALLDHLRDLITRVMRVRNRRVDAATLKGGKNVEAAAISCINVVEGVGSESRLLLLGFEEVPSGTGPAIGFHSKHLLAIYDRSSMTVMVAEDSHVVFLDLIPDNVESMYCLRGGRPILRATNDT